MRRGEADTGISMHFVTEYAFDVFGYVVRSELYSNAVRIVHTRTHTYLEPVTLAIQLTNTTSNKINNKPISKKLLSSVLVLSLIHI